MSARGALRVFAAGSLRPAFDEIAAAAPGQPAFEYDNARNLAERIRAGESRRRLPSASAVHPRALHDEAAGAWVDALSAAAARAILRRAGFGTPAGPAA